MWMKPCSENYVAACQPPSKSDLMYISSFTFSYQFLTLQPQSNSPLKSASFLFVLSSLYLPFNQVALIIFSSSFPCLLLHIPFVLPQSKSFCSFPNVFSFLTLQLSFEFFSFFLYVKNEKLGIKRQKTGKRDRKAQEFRSRQPRDAAM